MNDIQIAKGYINKLKNAKRRGIAFDLPLLTFINLMKAKRCKYTGVKLTDPIHGIPLKGTDRTVDRIDPTKGYVKGNVAAVCYLANKFKGQWENPESILTIDMAKKIIECSE